MYSVFVELLQRFNVSAYKVAKETGVSQTTMSNWKSGRSIPKHEIMAKIAKYFNVSEEWAWKRKEVGNMQMKINVKKGTEEHAECETDEITIYVSGSIEKQREMCLYALLELFTNEN